MVRIAWAVLAAVVLAASCSSSESTSGIGTAAGADPVVAFCDQWRPYEELVNSDPEVNEELVVEVRVMEEGLQAVVPSQLEDDLAASIDWNARFIEWFERNGYRQPATDEDFLGVFDGDEVLAEAALEAREAAFPVIDAWHEENCGAGVNESSLPAQFCAAWDELVALTADDAELDEGQWEQVQDIVDRASANVPAAVADDWTAMADFIDRYGAVLVSAEFLEERVTDEMLEQAFGSLEAYDQAVAAREAAAGAIGEWSLEGCGDFCARWPDMDQVRTELDWPQFVIDDPENGLTRLEGHLRTLAILDQLAPDEIAGTWVLISAEYRRWVDDWRQADFHPERLEEVFAARDPVEWARSRPYLSSRIDVGPDTDFYVRLFEAWQAGAEQVPDWVYEEWAGGGFDPERIDELREEIEASDPGFFEIINLFEANHLPWWLGELVGRPPADLTSGLNNEVEAWVAANCAETTGRSGTLRVRWPKVEGYAGATAVVALLPLGGSHGDLADVPSTLAAQCEPVSRDPWGVWIEHQEDGTVHEGPMESDVFRDERWSEDHLCGFIHEAPPPRIDAGAYTLVGGVMWGAPSDPAEGLDLVSCLTLDVRIDSDTIVHLPPFQPCDVRIGDGEPVPWRNPPPVDPETPGAGTLKVLVSGFVPSAFGAQEGGELMVVVLPAGATLNEVGREQLWPTAAVRTWLPEAGSQHATELARQGPLLVPLAPLPPSGQLSALDPDWLASGPADDKLPLAVLAPDTYDMRFELRWHTEEGERSRCAQTEVTVDGDTVIELPDLGECP